MSGTATSHLPCPYVGLMPFTESDAEYFCGRRQDIEIVAANMRACNLTILYGSSGVGKSSLLNAGVIPHLMKMTTVSTLRGEPPEFILFSLRDWANNPVESLRHRAADAVEKAVRENKIPRLTLAEVKANAGKQAHNPNLAEVLQSWTDLVETDLLIILDQFEDFFLYPEFSAGRGSLGEELPKIFTAKDLPAHILISLRDDAIARLDFFKGKIPGLMRNIIRLPHLNRLETETAIRRPLEVYNEKAGTAFSIETELVEHMLDAVQVDKIKLDTQGQANATPFDSSSHLAFNDNYQAETPYLQLVMQRLWKHEETQRTQKLSLATLTGALGGVQNIVETHLDEVMSELAPAQRELAVRFIHFTVTSKGSKITSEARSLADWAELNERHDDIQAILRELSDFDSRIFKVLPNRREPGNDFYEITHDALGPALLSWRKRQLETKQEQEAEKEKEALLAAEQRKHQKRLLAALTAGFILLALAFGGWYWRDRRQARKEAEANRLAAEAKERDKLIESAIRYQERIDVLEKELAAHKTLLELLGELRSQNPRTRNTGLSRLQEKAAQGELPEEYKPLYLEILKNSQLAEGQKEVAVKAVKDAKRAPPEPLAKAPSIIFLHIQANEQRKQALKVAAFLEKQGQILVPGIENTGETPDIKRNQLRYFRPEDQNLAQEFCRHLEKINIYAAPVQVSGYQVRPMQFELWFTGEPLPELKNAP